LRRNHTSQSLVVLCRTCNLKLSATRCNRAVARSDIEVKGLFLNADSGFDSKKLRDILYKKEIIGNIKENPRNGDTKNEKYFDNELYKRRFKIEKANAWLDSFKALLIRFEKLNITWINLHYIAFSILLLRKIKV